MDENARRAVPLACLGQRRCRLLAVGDIASHRMAADLLRHRAGAIEIDVQAGNFRACARELVRARRTETRGGAGDQHRLSLDKHMRVLTPWCSVAFLSCAVKLAPRMKRHARI
jgi:hypothetical protein